MLFQPSNINPDEVYGTGSVDLTENLKISWQVSGDSAMAAYKIDFFKNDALSTPLYSTTRVKLNKPFWGINFKGERQYFTAEIPNTVLQNAELYNGKDYKFLITQWWSEDEYVHQSTASVFLARSAPTLAMDNIPAVISSKYATFNAEYAQAQDVPLNWVRWEIAEAGNLDNPFYDTGKISGTGELKAEYDGFFTDTAYSIRCTAETATGVSVSTGWVNFDVSYAVEEASGNVTACPKNGYVLVSWTQNLRAYRYTVMRRRTGENRLVKIADVDNTTGQIKDYSARSNESYTYYIFSDGLGIYLTAPLTSNEVSVLYSAWTITEAEKTKNGEYKAIRSFLFCYGSGGVSEGAFSNNNTPQVSKNFTRYPTRQADRANYLTGNVGGLIGEISNLKEYSDSISQSDALMELSTSGNTLFLSDPKGHFLKIHTSDAISLSIDHKSKVMPQTMTVPWVEIGSAKDISLIYAAGGDFEAYDSIIFTTLELNADTGELIWNVPGGYSGGSILAIEGDKLTQTAQGDFTPASMGIDYDTGEVTAEV